MKNKGKICIGKIVSSHGIKGEVNIKTLLDNPSSIKKFKNVFDIKGERQFKIEGVRGQKNDVVIVKIDGIEDRDEADKLRGTELYIERGELPKTKENEFYYNDLIGLKVFEGDKEIGITKNIYNFGAGEILEIKLKNGTELDIPFGNDYVKDVDLKNGKIVIVKPEYVE